ncbi:MAG: hypothetical protein M0P61_00350 [Ignavibacteriaceae bacterium]|nr:hypothetical protein [Ignavibacteriaceae bacterium]
MDDLMFGELAVNGSAYGGASTVKELQDLAKALEVGYAMGTTDQTGFGATRLESLDPVVKWLTLNESSPAFFRAIRKGKASSTVEEFVTMNEVGDANFYSEGGLPDEYDEDIRREFEQVKYIGTVGKIPLQALMVKSNTNNEALVTRAKALAIMKTADSKIIYGDAARNPYEWNGYYKQFKTKAKNVSQNTIDLRGKRVRPETLNESVQIIADNWGNANNVKCWMSAKDFQFYTDELLAGRRFVVGSSEARDLIASAKRFELGNGKGNIETDILLKYKGQNYIGAEYPKTNTAMTVFAATNSKAPATLNSSTATISVDTDAATLLDAATYDYAFVPVNKYGAGAAFEVKTNVVAASKRCTFTLTDNGSPSGQEATSFDIYRKLSSATAITSYRYLTSFTAAEAKIDNGEWIPGATNIFLWDWDFEQVLDFRQLLPMTKMGLAQIDDSKRWMQKLWAVPILVAPNKMVMIKNAGSTAWA